MLSGVFLTSAFSMVTAAGDDEVACWNYMIYLQADNDLDSLVEVDMNELMAVGSDINVNVLVFMDRYTAPAQLYKVELGKVVPLDFDLNGVEVNTGNPAVFEAFVVYGETVMRAERSIMFFWDHGSPVSGVGVDEHTGVDGERDYLDHKELISVLQKHKVDVIAMDECSIGQIEVAYEYAMKEIQTEYMVASESYISNRGFPYDWILSRLETYPNMSALDLSLVCVQEFERLFSVPPYMSEILTTQSVIKLANAPDLASSMIALTDILRQDMQKYKGVITAARTHAIMPWGSSSAGRIDLPAFVQYIYDNAGSQSGVKAAAQAVLEACSEVVLAMGVTKNSAMFGFNGIGIYFPSSYSMMTVASAPTYEKYVQFEFPNMGWLEFLEDYWGV